MNLKIKSIYVISVLISLLFLSCNNKTVATKIKPSIKLAISKAHGSSGYEQYKKWIKHHDSTIIIYDLYDLTMDSAAKVLNIVDGLIISGGPDVNPARYNEDSLAYICEIPDNYRDSLEFQSIDIAYSKQLPILGICRGHQILNVYFGGSLIADIPSKHGTSVTHRCKADSCIHNINIVVDNDNLSYLKNDSLRVNSYHHQAINRLAKPLVIVAIANDSIIESTCFNDSINYPTFFLTVQFHPEHMIDTKVSNSIARAFILSIEKQSETKK